MPEFLKLISGVRATPHEEEPGNTRPNMRKPLTISLVSDRALR